MQNLPNFDCTILSEFTAYEREYQYTQMDKVKVQLISVLYSKYYENVQWNLLCLG